MTCFLGTGPLPKKEGEIKWFNPRKGYGFIGSGTSDDIFFHQNQVFDNKAGRPKEGQTVRFHLNHSPKGPEALNVELI
jgi:CspA family cold shock protein